MSLNGMSNVIIGLLGGMIIFTMMILVIIRLMPKTEDRKIISVISWIALGLLSVILGLTGVMTHFHGI